MFCLPLLGFKPKKIAFQIVLLCSSSAPRAAVSEGTRTQVSITSKVSIYSASTFVVRRGEFASSADRVLLPTIQDTMKIDFSYLLTPRMAVVLIRKLDSSDVGVVGGHSTIPLHRLGANGAASQPVRYLLAILPEPAMQTDTAHASALFAAAVRGLVRNGFGQ